MPKDRATHPKAEACEKGSAEPRRESPLLRARSVGASQRSTLKGSSSGVSVARDVLAATVAVGGHRRKAEPLKEVPRRTRRLGHPVVGRDVQRRDVLARKQRDADIAKTNRRQGTQLMVVADGRAVPLGVRIAPANSAELTLIEPTLEQVAVPRCGPSRLRTKPRRLIHYKGAASDALRLRLMKRGIELIRSNRSNRKRPVLQDGHSLRSYRRRWTIERTVASLRNFRRLVVRYERQPKMFVAFLKVACLMITLQSF
jgi:transposase